MSRPSWDETWMAIAQVLARRATCLKRKLGAVVVSADNRHIVGLGYNGAPHGQPHCLDVGCMEIHGHCERCLHAEANALLKAGEFAQHATLYITGFPCLECARMIVQCQVREVVYGDDYEPTEHAAALLQSAGVVVRGLR